jgi:mRNA degradation ribonuclease J1/J2
MKRPDHFAKRILMSALGVIICGISVGMFKHAALGVDPFQTLMSGLDAVVPLVEAELARLEADRVTDPHRVAQSVRRIVGRWVGDTYRRRPMIVPTVLAV